MSSIDLKIFNVKLSYTPTNTPTFSSVPPSDTPLHKLLVTFLHEILTTEVITCRVFYLAFFSIGGLAL
jgi:hypothetical protein